MKTLYTLLFSILFICSITSADAQTKRGSVNFVNADDAINVPHNSKLDLGSGAFTIEAWIQASPNLKTVATPAPIIICKKQEGTNSDGWMFGMDGNGKLAIELKGDGKILSGFGGGGGSGVAAIDLRDGQCHHVAVTREIGNGASDTVRGYQDGQYIKRSQKPVVKADISTGDAISIGYSSFIPPAQYQFEGLIKEIRVWNTTRTQSQIDANKTKWLKGNEPGLIAYWRINESEDNASTTTNVREYVANRAGTLTGGIWDQYCNEMDPLPVGIIKVAENNADIVVYPNPANQVINISGISNDAFEVNVFDMSGRIMLNESLNAERSIDVSNLDSGAYMLLLKNNDGSVYRAAFNVR